jgi:hypothetical protein
VSRVLALRCPACNGQVDVPVSDVTLVASTTGPDAVFSLIWSCPALAHDLFAPAGRRQQVDTVSRRQVSFVATSGVRVTRAARAALEARRSVTERPPAAAPAPLPRRPLRLPKWIPAAWVQR